MRHGNYRKDGTFLESRILARQRNRKYATKMSVSFPSARVLATFLLAVLLPVLVKAGGATASASPRAPADPVAVAAEKAAPPAATLTAAPTRVMVIPVREEIATPILYIIRRGLKEAIEQKADVVVLDMKTPGGALDVTFEIMEALGRFPDGRSPT